MRKKQWARHLAESMDLPGETMPGEPILELVGDRRVLIEGHRGVTEYSEKRICVKMRYGMLCICGCGLELTCMAREQLIITGKIDHVQLTRRTQ